MPTRHARELPKASSQHANAATTRVAAGLAVVGLAFLTAPAAPLADHATFTTSAGSYRE
jgi:hypothetical protein